MKQIGILALAGLMAVCLGACQKAGDKEMSEKLDELIAINKKILEQAQRGGGAAAARPQRPPGPDPTAVYSVPIEGSATVGPKHAKVTIVEGFEFA